MFLNQFKFFIIGLALFFKGIALAQAPTARESASNNSGITTAKIQGFTITANELSRDLNQGTLSLIGNVKVIYQNQYFEADRIELNLKYKKALLQGHVQIQSSQYQLVGEEIQLDYETNEGIIYNGYVQSNNVRFQGSVIQKMGDKEFYVADADYTTCSNCPATWSFRGSRIRAELGGYAYLKNTFLKLGGIPVLWLPYLIVPLKSERQTGLLTPEVGQTQRRGFYISESFFWAISRSQDATFTLKNYELAGLKPLTEYRYVLSEESFGQLNGAILQDNVFASEDRINRYRSSNEKNNYTNRWMFKSYQQQTWENQSKLRLQTSLVSDLQYPRDFFDEFKSYSDPALENRLAYTKPFDHSLINVETSYFKNLLQADPMSSNERSVQKLPELQINTTLKQFEDSPFYYKIDSAYTNFYRNKGYDDISIYNGQKYASNNLNDPTCEHTGNQNCSFTEDGSYDPNNDLIRSGQRLLFKATAMTKTYNWADFANISPSLSYNQAHYLFPVGENRSSGRRYLQFDIESRTKFYKLFESEKENSNLKYKHEIIPEVHYKWIPWIDHDRHPFFGNMTSDEVPYSSRTVISDVDINTAGGLQYDYADRFPDRHLITISLLNRLVRKKLADNSYKTLVDFRLSQSYDLYQSLYGDNKNQPLSDLSSTLYIDLDQIQSYSQVNYFPYLSSTDSSSWISYLNDKQQYFRIGYASIRSKLPTQDDVSLALGFVSPYINVLSGVVFDASTSVINSSRLKKFSLITQIKPPGECWAINFYREQKAGGSDSSWNIKFEFSFDGKPPKVIPPAELNIN